jgi:FkbM family methyltransferase
MRFRVPTYDRGLGLMAFAMGPPERDTMSLVISVLATRDDRPAAGRNLLEIGANIGTATVVALREGGFEEATCFEPLPDNHRLLLDNLAANGLLDRVQAMEIALSDLDGEAEFEISPNNSGDGRVRSEGDTNQGKDAFAESQRETVKVRLARLDSLCEQGLLDLDRFSLAWLDAQGHEGHILSGANRLLRSQIPIVTEFWPYGLSRAGGKRAFIDAVRANYDTVVDLGSRSNTSQPDEIPADRIEVLVRRYEEGSLLDPDGATTSTDLLLLKDAS